MLYSTFYCFLTPLVSVSTVTSSSFCADIGFYASLPYGLLTRFALFWIVIYPWVALCPFHCVIRPYRPPVRPYTCPLSRTSMCALYHPLAPRPLEGAGANPFGVLFTTLYLCCGRRFRLRIAFYYHFQWFIFFWPDCQA